MRITVEYMAQLKRVAGCASETVELPAAATLDTLLHRLADRHGEALERFVLGEEGRPQKTLLFFVGEESADANHALREGDRVTILSPMAGG